MNAPPRLAPALLVVLLLAAGCVSEEVRETAETVLTLQSGTVSELRERRGRGPFTTYEVAPDVMLGIVEEAARKARGAGGLPVGAIFVAPQRGEVVAKERDAEHAASTSYGDPFRTAMLAIVHPAPGRPDASRVEVHAIDRGPFHRGQVQWQRDMPRWIDAVLAERRRVEAQPPAALPSAPAGPPDGP